MCKETYLIKELAFVLLRPASPKYSGFAGHLDPRAAMLLHTRQKASTVQFLDQGRTFLGWHRTSKRFDKAHSYYGASRQSTPLKIFQFKC